MIKDIIDIYISRSSEFLEYFVQHLYIVSVALIFIIIVGLFLGIIMTYNKTFATLILALTGFLYTIPSIAMFGILV